MKRSSSIRVSVDFELRALQQEEVSTRRFIENREKSERGLLRVESDSNLLLEGRRFSRSSLEGRPHQHQDDSVFLQPAAENEVGIRLTDNAAAVGDLVRQNSSSVIRFSGAVPLTESALQKSEASMRALIVSQQHQGIKKLVSSAKTDELALRSVEHLQGAAATSAERGPATTSVAHSSPPSSSSPSMTAQYPTRTASASPNRPPSIRMTIDGIMREETSRRRLIQTQQSSGLSAIVSEINEIEEYRRAVLAGGPSQSYIAADYAGDGGDDEDESQSMPSSKRDLDMSLLESSDAAAASALHDFFANEIGRPRSNEDVATLAISFRGRLDVLMARLRVLYASNVEDPGLADVSSRQVTEDLTCDDDQPPVTNDTRSAPSPAVEKDLRDVSSQTEEEDYISPTEVARRIAAISAIYEEKLQEEARAASLAESEWRRVVQVRDGQIKELEGQTAELAAQVKLAGKQLKDALSKSRAQELSDDAARDQEAVDSNELVMLALLAELEAQTKSQLQDELLRTSQELEVALCRAEESTLPAVATDAIAQMSRLKLERDSFCDAVSKERELRHQNEKHMLAELETMRQSTKSLLLELGQSQLMLTQERSARVADLEGMHQQLRENADASWSALLSHRTAASSKSAEADVWRGVVEYWMEQCGQLREEWMSARKPKVRTDAFAQSGGIASPETLRSPDSGEFSAERRRRFTVETPLEQHLSSDPRDIRRGASPVATALAAHQQRFAASHWDPELSSNITLYPRGLTAAHPGLRVGSLRDSFACGAVGVSDGDVSYEVLINRPSHHRDASPETCLYVGLASRYYCGRGGATCPVYLYRSDGAIISHSDQTVGVPYGVPLRNGSLVTVRLSFTDQHVSFFVDNVFQGVAFKLSGPHDPHLWEPLFPLVVFGVDGDVATFERSAALSQASETILGGSLVPRYTTSPSLSSPRLSSPPATARELRPPRRPHEQKWI